MNSNNPFQNSIPVVALVLFSTSSKRLLICQRSSLDSGAGLWEFPGGKVESDETFEQALGREIEEELHFSISLNRLEFIDSVDFIYSAKKLSLHLYYYDVFEEIFNFKLVDHDQFKWVEFSELVDVKLTTGDQMLLNSLFEFLKAKV